VVLVMSTSHTLVLLKKIESLYSISKTVTPFTININMSLLTATQPQPQVRKMHVIPTAAPDAFASAAAAAPVIPPVKVKMSQSVGLSKRLTKMVKEGKHLNDDSCSSEETLRETMSEIILYANECFNPLGYTIIAENSISLFDCQSLYESVSGSKPNTDNKKVSMRPDGGILFAISGDIRIPILIVEDKFQGTNDNLFEQKKKRQSTGNAIERGAKNIRGAEMIFAGSEIFPYVMFASGCDFHSTETIAKRIEMMNMGTPNHYLDISNTTTQEQLQARIDDIVLQINLKKKYGVGIASVFVKAHKWNEMKHGSSLWKKEEQVQILKKIIDKVIESFPISSKLDT